MKFLCFIGMHWYKFKFQEGINTYYECKYCKSRTYSPVMLGDTKINKKWLNSEE